MAKQFLANRSGQTPTLDEVPNEVIKIYNDKAAADLDIANIEENEIVATKAGESEGVVEVVDTVEENNPNAVSSGAVYDYIEDKLSKLQTQVNKGDTFRPSTEQKAKKWLNITVYYGGSIVGSQEIFIEKYNNSTYKAKMNLTISGKSYAGTALSMIFTGDRDNGYAVSGNDDTVGVFTYHD